MPNTRPLKVFLCHASADKSAVRELYQRLKGEDWIDPWLDVARILPGQHWTSVIRQSLANADSVIILISNNSINREGFVQRELNYAWELSLEKPRNVIYLIPLRLEECDVPYDLRERQWADYFGEKQEETYLALLQSLKLRHEQKVRLEAEEQKQRDTLREKADREAEEKAGRENAEKVARERAERDAAEKADREAAEKAAREKAVREAKEKAERENAEKVVREKADREAKEKVEHATAEKLALENAERENTEKAAREKAAREAKEKAERAAAEKLALENTERENAEKVAREKAAREKREREAKRKITRESKPAPVNLRLLGIGGIILFACILGGFGLNYLINHLPVATSFPKVTLTPNPPTATSVPFTATHQPTQTPIPTPTLGTMIGSDGMKLLYVPAGEFKMGSTDADSLAQSDEKPQHPVTLKAFWIDQTEVTNKQYAACVSGGGCTPPSAPVIKAILNLTNSLSSTWIGIKRKPIVIMPVANYPLKPNGKKPPVGTILHRKNIYILGAMISTAQL